MGFSKRKKDCIPADELAQLDFEVPRWRKEITFMPR